MRNLRLCELMLLLVLSACSSSDNNESSIDNPPADDPVAGPDCLGDIAADGTTYCVDPDTQTVTATRSDGTIDWTKILADSDRTIDTLVLIDGQPWLFADSSSWIGQVLLDQDYVTYSRFYLKFAGFTQTSTTGNSQRSEQALLPIVLGNSAYIVTDIYELIDGADPDLDDSWQFMGASLSRNDMVSSLNYFGEDRAFRWYPDQHVQFFARTVGGHVLLESDRITELLSADTLLPTTSDPARALLGDMPHESVTPFLFTALRGDGLDQHAQQVFALGEQVRATASETDVIESNAADAIPPAGTDTEYGTEIDVLEKIDYTCMDGGELALERTERVTYNSSGIWPKTGILEHYRYSDCHVTVSDEDPLLPSGSYRLDGVFIYDNLNDVAFQNYTYRRVSHEWQQLSLDSPGQRSSMTTAQTVREVGLVVTPPNPSTDTIRITSHEERLDGELTLSIKGGDYTRISEDPYGGTQPYLRIVGNGTITATETGNQAITISIDPPIETSIDTTIYGPANVRTTGGLLASAADGSTMSVTAIDALSPYIGPDGGALWNDSAAAAADYQVTNGDAVLRETKSLNSLYISISLP